MELLRYDFPEKRLQRKHSEGFLKEKLSVYLVEPTNLSRLILLISVSYIGLGTEIGAFDVPLSLNLGLLLIRA